MKTRTILSTCSLLSGILLSMTACSKPEPTADAPAVENTQNKSGMQTAVEGLTGKTAVETGKQAEEKLDAINSKREEDIKDLETF